MFCSSMLKRLTVVAWLLLTLAQGWLLAQELPALGTRKAGQDWPGFLGPNNDSKCTETGFEYDWKKHPPKLLWSMKLRESYGMPSIARGRLVLFDRIQKNATVICMESETGRELWKFEYPTDYRDTIGYDNGPRCAPVIDQDRVYTLGAEGMLHCLTLADGKLLWKVNTTEKYGVVQNFFGVGSTPIIEGKLLIVHVGGSPAGSAPSSPERLDEIKPNGSSIIAFDKLTGTEVYRTGNDLASYASPVCATIKEKRYCFMFARSGLHAFDPVTGKEYWSFPWRADDLFSVNASNPIVIEDQVLLSECYGPSSVMLKVQPDKATIVWRDPEAFRAKKALQTHWNTPIYHTGFIYGSSGRHSNTAELRCVEAKTGKIQWSQPGLSRSSLLFVEGHLLCLNEYGDLVVFKANPQKFELVATWVPINLESGAKLLDYPAWAAPIISHGLLYVRGNNQLLCYELPVR
jgi:outer membrane protein assembly factor BamB